MRTQAIVVLDCVISELVGSPGDLTLEVVRGRARAPERGEAPDWLFIRALYPIRDWLNILNGDWLHSARPT